MKIKNLSSRLKKGFTLIELVAVMLTTSILFAGFTAFTMFFMNQYNYEMSINDKENSATNLKYAVSNNIDKFNYTYERVLRDTWTEDPDFHLTSATKENYEDRVLRLFQTVTPVEAYAQEGFDYYSGVILRDYKFVLATETKKSYFGYTERIYDFENNIKLEKTDRETTLRYSTLGIEPEATEEFIIYETLSPMVLEYQLVSEVDGTLPTNCGHYKFTIQYDFASDSVEVGTKQLYFDKYIYFVS